ncbi:hypothetical protein OIU78_003280 [Salix suchowensis]|nr:hypothetical protein OIU78_003280 [Salix suchowensis]
MISILLDQFEPEGFGAEPELRLRSGKVLPFRVGLGEFLFQLGQQCLILLVEELCFLPQPLVFFHDVAVLQRRKHNQPKFTSKTGSSTPMYLAEEGNKEHKSMRQMGRASCEEAVAAGATMWLGSSGSSIVNKKHGNQLGDEKARDKTNEEC